MHVIRLTFTFAGVGKLGLLWNSVDVMMMMCSEVNFLTSSSTFALPAKMELPGTKC